MVRLEPIGPDNWRHKLAVREDQQRFVGSSTGILARAYAYRERRAQARLILDGDTPVGMLLYYDWPEDREYVFSHLLIDRRYQRRGFGEAAARLALDEMRADGRYSQVSPAPMKRATKSGGWTPPGCCMKSWASATPARWTRQTAARSSWSWTRCNG